MKRALRASVAAALFVVASGVHPQPAGGAASAAQFPQLPLQRDAERGDAGLSLAWIGLMLIAGGALVFVWKRRGAIAPRSGPVISVQPGRALTAQASLHVIEWEGERLLVACTPHSVTVLAQRPSAAEATL